MVALHDSQGGLETRLSGVRITLLSEGYSAILPVNNPDSQECWNGKTKGTGEGNFAFLQGYKSPRHSLPACSSAWTCGVQD